MERKDRSNLRIVNQYNQEVLNMRYLNPQTLRINALLHYPGYLPLIIKENNFGDMFKSKDNDSFPWVCMRKRAIELFKDGSILIN
jgi:hypothetical protein